jgi:hypothetical protein
MELDLDDTNSNPYPMHSFGYTEASAYEQQRASYQRKNDTN